MKNRFIVRFDSKVPKEDIIRSIERLGAKVRYIYDLIPAAAIESSQREASLIRNEPNIIEMVSDCVSQESEPMPLKAQLDDGTITYLMPETLDDDEFERVPYLLKMIGKESAPIKLVTAIVDTGVDNQHPSLVGRIYKEIDFTGEGPFDFNGHGTIVAALAARAPGRIANVKVANRKAVFWESDVMAGIEWAAKDAVENNVRTFINLSLGVYHRDCKGDCPLCSIANAARDKGIVIFAAAGNFPGMTACPAKSDRVIAIGEVDKSGKVAPFSGKGNSYGIGHVDFKPFARARASEAIKQTKEKILNWLREEAFSPEEKTDPQAYFNILVRVGSSGCNIVHDVRHIDSFYVAAYYVLTGNKLALVRDMGEKKRTEFFWDIRMALLKNNELGNFKIEPNPPHDMQTFFISSKRVYYDGLSKGELIKAINVVGRAIVMVDWTLQQHAGMTAPRKDQNPP